MVDFLHSDEPGKPIARPDSTRVVVTGSADTELAFQLPRRRLRADDLPRIATLLMFLGLLIFVLIARAPIVLVFVIAGVFLPVCVFWSRAFNRLYERQRITLGKDRVTIRKRRLVVSKTVTILYAQILKIGVAYVLPTHPLKSIPLLKDFNDGVREGEYLRIPTIACRNGRTRFAEDLSLAEMEWLAHTLKSAVDQAAQAES